MRVIVAGPRWVTEPREVLEAMVMSEFEITTHICGCCPTGTDMHAEAWAKQMGIPTKHYRPDWTAFGKRAGPMRNTAMAQNADAAIILLPRDPHPMKGSLDMLVKAVAHKLKLYVHSFDGAPPEQPYIEPTWQREMDLWP